jgi:NDP-mannose synthase
MQAIILAGGKGTRLKPFTKVLPKPLVPIGDDLPILEIILKQLKYYGFKDITLAVSHLAELIMAFFQHGEKLDLNIKYSREDKILGTAGPLSLIDKFDENFIVMNGDLLTTLNYRDFFNYHVKNHNDLSMALYKKEVKIDLGVIETENNIFKNYIEKPTYTFDVSMGIYVINRNIIDLIPKNEKMDLPELVLKCQKLKKKIGCFKGDYYWLDIGRVEDYEKAIEIFEQKRTEFLPNQ